MSVDLALPRHPLVLGAARSGRAAAQALLDVGVEVVLIDDDPDGVCDAPCPIVSARAVDYTGCDVLIKSPGVPSEHPVVTMARLQGLAIWSEVELGYRLLPPGARVIGVTGTNGKTTTTELVGAMLFAAALPHLVCGNVGIALSEIAADLPQGTIVVCELSSFQLEDVISFHCDAAAITNITSDHLDRHGTLAAYTSAKLRIFERQDEQDLAVLNDDDPRCAELSRVPGSARMRRVHGVDAETFGFAEGQLRGDHNRENVAVAAALAGAMGVPDDCIRAAVAAFAAGPHRLEDCGVLGGVRFWNDSKATNVDATIKALTAFPDGQVRIILGGSDKGGAFEPLAAALSGSVLRAYLMGPAGRRMLPVLTTAGVDAVLCGSFDEAFERAAGEARAGQHVLLAPASASFDEFADYSERGAHFRALAMQRGAT